MSSELKKICNAQNEKNGLQVTIYFLVKRIVKYRPNISKLQVQRYMKCLLMSHSSNVLWHNFFSQKDCMICFDEKRQSIFRPHFHWNIKFNFIATRWDFYNKIWHFLVIFFLCTLFENQQKCLIRVFQFWHFPLIFVQLKNFRFFKNSPKLTIFGLFDELLSTQNINLARFARNLEWAFFCDFQTPCIRYLYRPYGENQV